MLGLVAMEGMTLSGHLSNINEILLWQSDKQSNKIISYARLDNLKTDPKRMLLLNNCYTTVSGPFFAMCMFIFHKTEVQRVILICLMGLNFNWFKSYGLKCILRLNATLANSQKMATDKWPIYEHFWSFFCQLYIHLSQN